MRAIVISRHGGPEVLAIRELADPEPADGEVLIRVHAFGLNHAEAYMRSGAWGDVAEVTGIECAGTVVHDSGHAVAKGTKVVAILGGMGRTRNGSYAELVTVPASNVVPVETSLSWTDLVAIPETYATAWSALRDNLDVQPGQCLLVRGATSALGQAVVDLAVDAGAKVVATTRNVARTESLTALGASEVLIDDGELATEASSASFDAVVDMVGNSVLRDSLKLVRPRGRYCQLGFLGGLAPVDDFNPITDLPSAVQLSFFGSAFVLGSPEFPLDRIPFAEILGKIERGILHGKPVRTYAFDEIVLAHQAMEAGDAGGKMVVGVA